MIIGIGKSAIKSGSRRIPNTLDTLPPASVAPIRSYPPSSTLIIKTRKPELLHHHTCKWKSEGAFSGSRVVHTPWRAAHRAVGETNGRVFRDGPESVSTEVVSGGQHPPKRFHSGKENSQFQLSHTAYLQWNNPTGGCGVCRWNLNKETTLMICGYNERVNSRAGRTLGIVQYFPKRLLCVANLMKSRK